jgi:uncharacterized protein (TIGR00661 family)
LYGCQGTGNGHLTRARVMAKELKKSGIETDFLFSGRDKSKYFDMEIFGNPIYKKGLTFDVKDGKINYVKTLFKNSLFSFFNDVRKLDLSEYDLIISDYEPITAWAARRQNRECIGLGHQYAFEYDIPMTHSNLITRTIMREFAPATIGIGLHWHHFNQHIFPPIIDIEDFGIEPNNNKILIYLPFENKQELIGLFLGFQDYHFIVYGFREEFEIENIEFKLPSKDEFQTDLMLCGGVICNAGFELASEALQLGRKLMVKPVHGQMEQHCNAQAIFQLDYGMSVNELSYWDVQKFLKIKTATKINYPNVAAHIVKWLKCDRQNLPNLSIWKDVQKEIIGL